jgi:hypothetical protein
MVVDSAGGTTGDRADCGARPTAGYGTYGGATRGSHPDTPNGPANVMMATVNGMVVVMLVVVRVGRSCRH